jgi:hypothetical protein
VTLALDHIVVGAATLEQGRAWARDTLGVEPEAGGRHALMGTHNLVLRLDDPARELYLEIIAIDPRAPDPGRTRWFDLDQPAVQEALASEPGLIAWVARSDDLDGDRERLLAAGFDPGPIHAAQRDTPTGTLRWRITIRDDGRRLAGGAIPGLIAWETPSPASSLPRSGVSLERLVVGGVSASAGTIVAEGATMVATRGRPLEVVLRCDRRRVMLDPI